jgi:acyl homoserine lactone synthase
MQHTVVTSTLGALSPNDQNGMFRLRYRVFHERLGWEVRTSAGLEVDEFDGLACAHYILARSPNNAIDACWRLLPTLGPHMLRDVFPELLHAQPAPASADVWELSRFALATDRLNAAESAGNPQIGFGELSVALMAEATRWARANGISRYVTVTTAAIERLLKKQGVNVCRLGPPIRVGHVLTLACYIEIDDVTQRALRC